MDLEQRSWASRAWNVLEFSQTPDPKTLNPKPQPHIRSGGAPEEMHLNLMEDEAGSELEALFSRIRVDPAERIRGTVWGLGFFTVI